MANRLDLTLDRAAKLPLTDQIRRGIGAAIESGVLPPGTRLPSWQDLAAQLGVARGTVRIAYEKLAAAQLIEASRALGTRVAERPRAGPRPELAPAAGSFMQLYQELTQGPGIFQMGVPGAASFPATLIARLRSQAVRAETSGPPVYHDVRGEPELRREIAGYLAVARGIACAPEQIFITAGYGGGLGLALGALRLHGQRAWVEDPGFPLSRRGVELAGLSLFPVPVDACGIDVDHAIHHCPEARLAVVTPGQQAPLGPTLSLERRLRLLDWAARADAWIVEDDYLSELQLAGRAAPALASLDRRGRVIHVGSFSKTISPTLRLGFVVVPAELVGAVFEVAACLAPPPGPAVQRATALFMREGHYLRHLRRTKRAYAAQQGALVASLRRHLPADRLTPAGLAVLLPLPEGAPDVAISREALAFGMSPAPLSSWYAAPDGARAGLLLGVATAPARKLDDHVDRLCGLVARFA
jgi:GntR family transcriptional regulator/MocR family aminotransferase